MTEKDLIKKIRQLRQIKPREDWVFLAKKRILEEEPVIVQQSDRVPIFRLAGIRLAGIRNIFNYFNYKLAFVSLAALMVIIGIVGFAHKPLVESPIYSIKLSKEPTTTKEVTEEKTIAINEYQASVSELAQNLVQKQKEIKKDPEKVKQVVAEVKNLEEKKQALEKVYGAELEEPQQGNPTKILAEWLIEDLENSSLTEQQKQGLVEIKKDYQKGNYSQALDKILLLTQ